MALFAAHFLRFAVAGMGSAAFAGILGSGLYAAAAAGPFAFLLGIVFGIGMALPAIKVAGIPATLLGGTLWTLGRYRHWARRRRLWCAVGALVGLGSWQAIVILRLTSFSDAIAQSPISDVGIGTAFAATGAVAALAFRAVMRLMSLFFPEPESL